MKTGHDNPKDFEKRTAIESKKAKDLSTSMEKVRKSIDV